MRNTILLSALLLFLPASAQQITNVTWTPSPLHGCVPVTFNISGTGAGGLNIEFVESSFGTDFVSLTLTVTTGPGSSSFTTSLGPYSGMAEGEYALTFSLKRNGNITSTWNGTMTVLPPQLPNMGEHNDITVCPNEEPFQLISRLGGTPDPGGIWVDPALNPVPSGMFIPGVSMGGEYVYLFELPEPCEMQYQTLNITNLPNTSAGQGATISLCTLPGQPSVDLFTHLGGSPQPGGTWSGPAGSSTGIFTPGTSPTGNYVYQVPGTPPCSDPTATITVQAAPTNNAGTGGAAVFCFDETNALLAPYLTGAETTGYWLEPTGFAIAYYNDPINVSIYGAGVYRYVVEESVCPGDTASVTVTLDGPPCTLGVDAPAAGTTSWQLSPNPATGQVTVEGHLDRGWQGLELIVTDVGGRAVLRQALPGSASFRQVIDLSTLTPGAYLVQVSGGPQVPTQRLLVH